MKRIGAIISLSLIAILMSASLCFAAGTLEITGSYPKEDQSNLQNVNCGVKIYFNQEVYTDETQLNENHFKLVDEKGKQVPTQVLYNKKEPNMVMVLAEKDLEINAGYKLKISDQFESPDGKTLGEAAEINFRTRDTSKDMTVNMVMMVVMFGGMMFFSSKAMKKQMQKQSNEEPKEEKFNPYKVSKETGKPVEEVIAQYEKEKAKKEKMAAKKAAKTKTDEEEDDQDTGDSDNKKVKTRASAMAAGSTYVVKYREQLAKEAAERAAKGTTKPKNQKNKKKKK